MSIGDAPPEISVISSPDERPRTTAADPAGGPALQRIVSTTARSRSVPRWLRRTSGPLLLLVLWQVLSSTGVLAPDILASPGTIARTAGILISDGTLPSAMLVSLQRVAVGLVFGTVTGTGLGLLSGLSRLGEDLIDAAVQMLRAVPFVGMIPLFIIWLGIGETPRSLSSRSASPSTSTSTCMPGSEAWTRS